MANSRVNVRMPFEFQDLGVSEAEKKKRVQECLELVDLDGFENLFHTSYQEE